jgi:colicin import membrane protein
VKPKPTPQKTLPKPKQKEPLKMKKPASTSAPKSAKEPSLAEINSALERAVKKYTGESTDAGGKGYGSSGEGGQGFGGGQSRPPEFFQYQETLENFVKSGWAWHDPVASLKASVCFELASTGALLSVRLCNSSGDRKFDESVVRAVQKADPLPMPPAAVYEYFREVRMTFTPQLY